MYQVPCEILRAGLPLNLAVAVFELQAVARHAHKKTRTMGPPHRPPRSSSLPPARGSFFTSPSGGHHASPLPPIPTSLTPAVRPQHRQQGLLVLADITATKQHDLRASIFAWPPDSAADLEGAAPEGSVVIVLAAALLRAAHRPTMPATSPLRPPTPQQEDLLALAGRNMMICEHRCSQWCLPALMLTSRLEGELPLEVWGEPDCVMAMAKHDVSLFAICNAGRIMNINLLHSIRYSHVFILPSRACRGRTAVTWHHSMICKFRMHLQAVSHYRYHHSQLPSFSTSLVLPPT